MFFCANSKGMKKKTLNLTLNQFGYLKLNKYEILSLKCF